MEIKTKSINTIFTATEGGKAVLLTGLKEAYRGKPQYRRYLQKEYERVKELDNANIFKVLSINDTENNGLVIETEWEDSRTLAEWLKEEGHSVDEKKRILRQVASALRYMHGQGLVQGNVNSQNVFITRKGDNVRLFVIRPRYTDMLSQPGDTLRFLAPEAKDGTVGLDARADIYSLGVMVREMGLDEEYHAVVERCCRFGRNERFGNVDEFIDAIERRRYTRPKEIREDTPSASTSSSKKMAVIVAVLVVLIGVAVALFVTRNQGDEETVAQSATEQIDESGETSTAADMDSTLKQQPAEAVPSDSTGAAYTGDNAFLAELVPQMQTDLDKIYNSGADAPAVRHKVNVYYKGLRRVLKKRHLNNDQLAAFDKAFADYVKSKQ